MNEIFEKIYNDNNTDLNESSALFEKVYTEAEMLNEMNPKLRALLAAGLIGTASLGAASCSMPTDDPTIYEQPAPETTVTFESLGVEDEAIKSSLAGAVKTLDRKSSRKDKVAEYGKLYSEDDYGFTSYIYIDNHIDLVPFDRDGEYIVDQPHIRYETESSIYYYVSVSMESDFDAAITAYKAAHAE